MDALALLCQRCGADAAVLKRLRLAGLSDFADVTGLGVDDLALVIGATRELALALQREARALQAQTSPPADDLASTALRPNLFTGLDPDACVRLREFGVETVGDLAGTEPLELSQAMELGVTRVMRLQFLARRFAEEHARRKSGASTEPPGALPARFSPAEREAGAAPVLAGDLEAFAAERAGASSGGDLHGAER